MFSLDKFDANDSRVIKKYLIGKRLFAVPFSEFDWGGDERVIGLCAYNVQMRLKQTGIESDFLICYPDKKIFYLVRRDEMRTKFTIEIPYERRELYEDLVIEVNSLISSDGLAAIFVSNLVYCLEAFFVIETNEHTDEIKKIICKNGLKFTHEKGVDEFFDEQLLYRKWDMMELYKNFTEFEIRKIYQALFAFPSESALKNKGYEYKKQIVKKKLFISYSHRNQDLVFEVIEQLKDMGISIWVDTEDISVGDSILEKIHQGLEASDLAAIFISKETAESLFAMHELHALLNKWIYQKKPLFVVKIDDVDMNSIGLGLDDIKYFDYSKSDIQNLALSISKKINQIQ